MVVVDLNVCDRCGTCIAMCPTNSILLAEMLSVDAESCSRCGRCVAICPFGALTMEKGAPDER